MALHDLRQFLYRLGEAAGRFGVLGLEPDPNEERKAHADLRSVDHCHVALDDAGFLEQPNTPKTRRRRESNLLRQLHVLQPAVALKGPKDAFVDVVKHEWNPISQNTILLAFAGDIMRRRGTFAR
jgi:hypothetical protein